MLQLVLALALSLISWASQDFPIHPDPDLTPGSYCTHPDSYRYPERIPYCKRNVSKGEKWHVINQYNQKFQYQIDRNERAEFKIDHLIPLCAGGSNASTNLWPQHRSVYGITDPLEGVACEKMAAGRLTQKRAVELLMQAKYHLDQAPQILKLIRSL